MKIDVRNRLGLLSLLIFLACGFSAPAHGYTVDTILMCDDMDPATSAPHGPGDIYLTQSGYAYCWMNLTDVYDSHVVRFDWSNPVGDLYASNTITTDAPDSGDHFPIYEVYRELEIHGRPPATNPGQWTVKVYVDNSLVGTREFIIVDYDAIIERTDALESQVLEIVSSFEELVSNYEDTQEVYEELLSDYDDLLDTYDSLTISYDQQLSDFEEILDEKTTLQEEYSALNADFEELVQATNQLTEVYNDLVDDYASADQRLSNSRNISYASMGLAVVFLAAAIYMYMKR